MCSSTPSACWRFPVHFSSRSSLCEEFGKWWGYTAEWQVSEHRLPGWSDRTNWSLALQNRETVRPSHRSGAQSVLNASTHAWVAVGCMLFLHHLCRSVKRRRAHKQINNETNHKVYLYFAAVLFEGIISPNFISLKLFRGWLINVKRLLGM